MLIAASAGSMALGVLAAYGTLQVGFALMRPQGKPIVKGQSQTTVAEV
jgi:hypothetical protein